MQRIAFATCRDLPELAASDRAAAAELAGRGVVVEAAIWDDAAVDWSRFAAVVVRSCWDYYLEPERFLAWAEGLSRRGVRLLNPAALIRWNVRKTYLSDLAARGVAVVPTIFVAPGEAASLSALLDARGWERAVLKPQISASAYETFLLPRERAPEGQALLDRLVGLSGAMVQPYVEEVTTRGELSLIFLGGRFSHAVKKLPRAGDFRVQLEHGGAQVLVTPGDPLIAEARRAVEAIEGPWLFARVDGVEAGGRLLLMELELIEPELFLCFPPGAVRFADALTATLAEGQGA